MTHRDYLLAPAQAGIQATDAWRFWYQGAEFYAASQTDLSVSQTKCSFHSGGKWQGRVGQAKVTFAPWKISPYWIQALSLRWLLWPGAFRHGPVPAKLIKLIDVPEGHQLSVHLLASIRSSAAPPLVHPEWGLELWRAQLRDGRWIVLQQQVAAQTRPDAEFLLKARRGLEPEPTPESGVRYAEIHLYTPDSEQREGNFATILPLGPDSFT